RLDAGGDERGERVVVADLDLLDRDGVVLVHDGEHAEVEEPREGAPRVEEALARGEVVGGEQHLRDLHPVRRDGALPGGDEVRLAHRRGRLLRRDVPGPRLRPHEAELLGAERDRARADEHDAPPARRLGQLGAEPRAVRRVERAGRVGERARPHLHDEVLEAGEGGALHGRRILQQGRDSGRAGSRAGRPEVAMSAAHHLSTLAALVALALPSLAAAAEPAVARSGLPYAAEDKAPKELVDAIRARRTGGKLLNLDRMLLHSPNFAKGWNGMFGAIRNQLSAPPKLRELVIMAVGALNRADYEWAQHE